MPLSASRAPPRTEQRRGQPYELGQVRYRASRDHVIAVLDLLGPSPHDGDVVQIQFLNNVGEPLGAALHRLNERDIKIRTQQSDDDTGKPARSDVGHTPRSRQEGDHGQPS